MLSMPRINFPTIIPACSGKKKIMMKAISKIANRPKLIRVLNIDSVKSKNRFIDIAFYGTNGDPVSLYYKKPIFSQNI